MGWAQIWTTIKTVVEIAAGDRVASDMTATMGFGLVIVVGLLFYPLRRLINRDRRMGPSDLILLGLLGIFVSSGLVIGAYVWQRLSAPPLPATAPATSFTDVPLKPLVGLKFANQSVELDGREFIDCTFENVTLVFNGTAPTRFTNVHFSINTHIRFGSGNPVVKNTIQIIHMINQLSDGKSQILSAPQDSLTVRGPSQ